MRKSSLGRRSSTINNDSSLAASASFRPEKRSLLLQPGFSQVKRRASSEEPCRVGPLVMQSAGKSRCDMSYFDTLPPCTPRYFKDNMNLMSGGARPSRSRTSSVDSNRFSSLGSIKCSKKETRPINDKSFQSAALKKVQDFFQQQPTCLQILDNSYNVKPMSLKKFTNMIDYLLKFIDERTNVNKDNYIDCAIRTAKMLNYGGKMDRSWLQVVNAQHTWCHVIAFLVWLVELVTLQEQVRNVPDLLYPEPLANEVPDDDLLEANIKFIQPWLVEQFEALISNRHNSNSLEKADEILLRQLVEKHGLTEEDFQDLRQKEIATKASLENPEYQADELRIQKQDSELEEGRVTNSKLKDYIEKTNAYIEDRTNEFHTMTKEIETLSRSIKEKTLERDKLHKVVNELRHKAVGKNETNQQRLELQHNIQYNEKCLDDLSKSLYGLEILSSKLLKQLEGPLVQYNNLIALETKNEPRLKDCIIDREHLLSKQGNKNIIIEIDKKLLSLKNEWKLMLDVAEKTVLDLQCKLTLLKETESAVGADLQKKKENLDSINKDLVNFKQQKEENSKKLLDCIKYYEDETAKLLNNIPSSVNQEELEQLKKLDEVQNKTIKETFDLSVRYIEQLNNVYHEMLSEAQIQMCKVLKDATKIVHGKKKEKGKKGSKEKRK